MKTIFAYLRKHKWLSLLLASGWSLLIFIGCSLPGRELPKLNLFDHFDKVVHFLFFFIFYWLWMLSFQSKKMQWGFLFLSILYGVLIEFYQKFFVAGRSFDIWDAVADTAGALVALLIMRSKHVNSSIKY